MSENLEGLIKKVYRNWKRSHRQIEDWHPDEEFLACFLEGRLSPDQSEKVKVHLLHCNSCAEALALNLGTIDPEIIALPEELLSRVRERLKLRDKFSALEIFLRLREKTLEIINVSGDILVGQELVPAPVLRARNIRDFKDEVTILKDFKDISVEVRIENKAGEYFNAIIRIKEKIKASLLKELRVTLIKDGLELESYLVDSGVVTFEHLHLGRYQLQINSGNETLALVILEVKV
ncbi:MAG: hypothetical protein NTW13_03090 [Candidatus Omnitrophica bacterium]|nr:hypothetical protein [Candidatus Omnitrophota bacterium]